MVYAMKRSLIHDPMGTGQWNYDGNLHHRVQITTEFASNSAYARNGGDYEYRIEFRKVGRRDIEVWRISSNELEESEELATYSTDFINLEAAYNIAIKEMEAEVLKQAQSEAQLIEDLTIRIGESVDINIDNCVVRIYDFVSADHTHDSWREYTLFYGTFTPMVASSTSTGRNSLIYSSSSWLTGRNTPRSNSTSFGCSTMCI
jgi:hypothetical protein